MLALGLVVVAGAVAGVVGAPNPTEPSATSVFNVGGQCTIKWDVDATATWKSMSIQLMTGDNWNMIPITTFAQGIDATDATKNTYSWTCPEVTPTSAIYFYQFSDPSEPTNLLWTTRWTIAGADGSTTTPTETTQPNGDKIPWGKGALVDPSTAVPPPSYLNNNQGSANSTSAAGSSAPAGSTVVLTTSAAGAATTPAAAATTPAGSSSHAASSSTARAATTGASTGASSSSTNSTSQTSANGAISTSTVSGFAAIGAFVAALGLF